MGYGLLPVPEVNENLTRQNLYLMIMKISIEGMEGSWHY